MHLTSCANRSFGKEIFPALLLIFFTQVQQLNFTELEGMAFGLKGDVSGREQCSVQQGESFW